MEYIVYFICLMQGFIAVMAVFIYRRLEKVDISQTENAYRIAKRIERIE